MSTLSINSRMLIAASIILCSFFGLTGVALDKAFLASSEQAVQDRLEVHLHALIAAAEVLDDDSIEMSFPLPEPRFFTERSGLYAKIFANDGQVEWRSISMDKITIPFSKLLARGEVVFQYMKTSDGEPLLVYALGMAWADDEVFHEGYTFIVAENLEEFNHQLAAFRQYLWGWLAAVTIVLLFVLTGILRWGLAPLRRVANDLRKIEAGRNQELEEDYPTELQGLTGNLNALIRTNREHEERYQASLGDLAHSLKTPLAVLRGAVETPVASVEALNQTVEEQVERMDQIVHYQLQRAANSGRTALTAPVDVAQLAYKVVNALGKVYADKGINCDVFVEADLMYHCDEGDMMEMLGNVLDNAFKWAKSMVEVRIHLAAGQQRLLIDVRDNGPGIADVDKERVLSRGVRADEVTPGHGLGMALVRDIVDLYRGDLVIERADLGGARIKIYLPIQTPH